MDPKTFGGFIQSQRKALGLTQADLAEKLHVTDKAVSRWERGVGFPEVTALEPLAKALEVTLLELMQSRKMVADTLSTGEAEAVVAGALEIAQEKRKKMTLRICGIGAYIGICLTMVFLYVTVMWFVDVLWIRTVSSWLILGCANLAMDGVSQELLRRADPEDPLLRRNWKFHTGRMVLYFGSLFLLLSISFVSGLEKQLQDGFQAAGTVLSVGGCILLIASNRG